MLPARYVRSRLVRTSAVPVLPPGWTIDPPHYARTYVGKQDASRETLGKARQYTYVWDVRRAAPLIVGLPH